VRLLYQPREVSLTISDDGQGFDPSAAPAAGHFGLQGMRERASGLGTFSLESRPGGGTRIAVRVSRQELHDG
jgi:signal transduction histidine kinase